MRPLPNTNPSHTAIELEHIARDCKSSSQARRLRAIAMVMLGAERSEAARAQAVDTQSLRDWIVLYNEGGVDGLRPARRGGRRCRLSASPLEMVAGWIDAGPEVGEDVPSRFRLRDIAERIAAVFFGTVFAARGPEAAAPAGLPAYPGTTAASQGRPRCTGGFP